MGEVAMRIAGENKKALARKVMLNKTVLDKLVCPPGRRDVHVYDAKVPGLAYRLTSNGARAWYLIRRIHGRSNRLKLGGRDMTVEQARDTATKENAGIISGRNPVVERRTVRQSATLGELWTAYKDKHLTPRASAATIRTDTSRWDTCFVDWASRKALAINESDVRAFHSQLGVDHGHTTANRAMQLLRRMYNWARLGVNPVSAAKVEMFNETSRERFVQPDELPKLFKALDDEQTNPLVRDFIYTALFTGARRSNVMSMRDDEINLHTAVWTIPPAKSKNKKAMSVTLSPPVLKIIRERIGHPSGFIFPSDGKTGHLVEPKGTWGEVLKRAGLKDLHLHDLRRTLGSWQAAAGASLSVIGASLGHQDHATTQIYARLNLDPVRASVDVATAAMVQAAKAKPKGKVKK